MAAKANVVLGNVSLIERRKTRIGEAKAMRICAALGVEIEDVFLRVLPANTAARLFGLQVHTLREAALHPDSTHIIPHAVEGRDDFVRLYFLEDVLREQLAALPSCKVDGCGEKALARSGYCTPHKTWAARERITQAIARPAAERLWLTEDEAAAETRRAWDTVNRAIRCGDLRAFRINGRVLIPKRDLAEWAKTLPVKYGMHRPTRLELGLRALLDELGVEFDEQRQIGNYKVDAYIPRLGLVIEADGSHWHQSEAKERTRDAYLLRNPIVRDVLHLTADQLAPWTPADLISTEYRTAIRAA